MILSQVSMGASYHLPAGMEYILTWNQTKVDVNKHHTKKEYLKIFNDGCYEVTYKLKWIHQEGTTQPLMVTIYRIKKDYTVESLHQHVTVCTGSIINLNKTFPFQLEGGERVCIGAKNLSNQEFILQSCEFSLTQK